MPKNITQYNLLISCPGDIQTEIEQINRAVDDFNERYSDVLGISVRPKHWRKSSYAQSGDKPQNLLNKQFVEDCDAAVALLWTRFGTPTDKYGSGTEEEIEIMLEAGKQVFMYFSDKPLPPSKQDPDEYNRVKEFRKKYKERGMYFTYSSDEEFYRLFSAHLTKFFLSLEAVSEITANRVSKLKLCGIGIDGELYDTIPVQEFTLNVSCNMEEFRIRIRQLFQCIADLHLNEESVEPDKSAFHLFANNDLSPSTNGVWNTLHTAVKIEEGKKNLIIQLAELIGFELPDDFFLLGNLSENKLSATAKFKGYDASVRHPLANSYHPSSLNMFAHDYSDDYEDELENIFCYTTYLENSQYALKLKFDYIKHHTVVAFPTPIFLKRIPDEIEYEITSRNSPDVIRGKLTVVNKATNIE